MRRKDARAAISESRRNDCAVFQIGAPLPVKESEGSSQRRVHPLSGRWGYPLACALQAMRRPTPGRDRVGEEGRPQR
jgi:hypothetical protein